VRVLVLLTLAISAFGQTVTQVDYNTQVKNRPIVSDAGAATFAVACARGSGGATVSVTVAWLNVPTQSCSANLAFNGGSIQPAAGATVTLTGSITAPPNKILDYSAGGTVNLSGSKLSLGVLPQWLGVTGSGANETVNLQNALDISVASGKPLYVPTGTYAMCNISTTTTGAVTITGAGMNQSKFIRHSSCLHSTDTMLTATFTGSSGTAELRNFSISNVSSNGSLNSDDIDIFGASRVLVDGLYIAKAETAGLGIQSSSNVTITNSTIFENYWFGISVANGNDCCGGTATPAYLYNYNFSGNTYVNQPIGLGLNFFMQIINISGETFDRSNLSLVQMPHAKATISNITIKGVPTQGCTAACGLPATQNGLFLEGVADLDLSAFHISDLSGIEGGIFCVASTLTIPNPGTMIQLPCSNIHITGGTITDVTAGYSISIAGQSPGPGPVIGQNNTIKGTVLKGVNQCPIISSTDGFEISDVSCENAANGGFSLGSVLNGVFQNNRCRNCNTAGGGGNYPGLTLSGATLRRVKVFNNTFENNGSSLNYGIRDTTGVANNGAEIQYSGNICATGCPTLYNPAPAAPLAGTWAVGSVVENNYSSGGITGWRNTVAGTPGTWQTMGYLDPDSRYTTIASNPVLLKGTISNVSQTAAFGPAPINSGTLSTGLYRVSYRARSTAACATPGPGSLQVNLAWIDELFGVSTTVITMALGSVVTNPVQGVYILYVGNTYVNYQAYYTACTTGTGTYSLQLTLEKLQ